MHLIYPSKKSCSTTEERLTADIIAWVTKPIFKPLLTEEYSTSLTGISPVIIYLYMKTKKTPKVIQNRSKSTRTEETGKKECHIPLFLNKKLNVKYGGFLVICGGISKTTRRVSIMILRYSRNWDCCLNRDPDPMTPLGSFYAHSPQRQYTRIK